MDGYEAEIDRQPSGPFSNRAERKRIRSVTERIIERWRYSEERNRRVATWAKWIGIVTPVALAAIKIGEAFFSKAGP